MGTPLSIAARTTPDVLNSHLGAFAQGLDAIVADYAEASVLITPESVYRGLAEIGGFFQAFLNGATPEFWAAFQLHARVVEADVAYITWSARPAVPLATDTLIVRDGRIVVQTFTAMPG